MSKYPNTLGRIEAVWNKLGGEDGVDRFLRGELTVIDAIITRWVKVDRDISPQAMLDATDRIQHTNKSVVESMPRGEGEEVEVCFFELNQNIDDDELAREYKLRGLVPADPYSLMQVNTDDPSFAGKHPNTTHWKNSKGKWCYTTFERWRDERRVYVYEGDRDWLDGWFFAGLRK